MQNYREVALGEYKKAEVATLVDTKVTTLRESWSHALQSALSVDTVTA
jgi:hypothetical protein